MSKRIYHVRSKAGAEHLVRAHSPASAIKKAAEGHYTAEPAQQETIVALMKKGHDVVDAEQPELPLEGNTAT
jgi:hypothetical protein